MSDPAQALIGSSEAIEEVRSLLRANSKRMEPVLIVGAPGTGKALAARTLHALSERPSAPFVHLRCAAIVAEVFDAELYGRELEAGAIDRAQTGTLYLDLVDQLDAASLAKLERLLDDHEFTRVGSREVQRADVRVVRSVLRVPKGVPFFRRPGLVRIPIPPLRERVGDVGLLAAHFLSRFGPLHGSANAFVTPEGLAELEHLARTTWGGNLRDFSHSVELRLVRESRTLDAAELETMRPRLQAALEQSGGRAAQRLGMGLSALVFYAARLGLKGVSRGSGSAE